METYMGRRLWIVLAWIGVILFSSTSLAGDICERAFRIVSRAMLGLKPGQSFSDMVSFAAEKSVHVALFAVLAILLSQAFSTGFWPLKRTMLVGVMVAIGSEYAQHFFPGRDPTFRDVAINLSGFTIGILFSTILLRPRMLWRRSIRP